MVTMSFLIYVFHLSFHLPTTHQSRGNGGNRLNKANQTFFPIHILYLPLHLKTVHQALQCSIDEERTVGLYIIKAF